VQTQSQGCARWRLFPHLVFRSTGFPLEILEGLRFERTVELAREILDAEGAIREASALLAGGAILRAVEEEGRGSRRKQVLRSLSKARQRVGRGAPPARRDIDELAAAGMAQLSAQLAALLAHHERREELLRQGREVFGRELEAKRAALAGVAADWRFQEALFISNPNMLRNALPAYREELETGRRGARLRKHEKKLIAYVQRFCAKNDTAAFFGPMNHGQVDLDLARTLDLAAPPERTDADRMVFFSFWAVEALADRISADPEVRQWLKPRLNPICSLIEGKAYFHFLDKSISLGAPLLRVALAANGKRTLEEIAQRSETSIEGASRSIEQLARAQVLIWKLSIPSTIFHPFDHLAQAVRNLPASAATRSGWLSTLDELDRLRIRYCRAPLTERLDLLAAMEALFQRVAGVRPERAAGSTYADRSIIYEESGGEVERLALGRPFVDDLQRRLLPALRMCQAYGEQRWIHYQQVGRQVLEAAGAEDELPYSTFVNVLKNLQQTGAVVPLGERAAALRAEICEAVRKKSDGAVARLSAEDIEAIIGRCPFSRRNYHVSPDMLISAASLEDLQAGRYQIVLGEFHAFMLPWGSQLYFYPEREEAERALAEAIGEMREYGELAIVLNVRRHKGLILDSFPGTFIEMFAKSSKEEGAGALPISQVMAVFEGGELKLREAGTEKRFKIYTGGDEKLNLWLFAPPPVLQVPISLGRHTPRVEIEGVVYQRERWEVPDPEVIPRPEHLDPFDRFLEIWRRKARLGLPDRVFVKASAEKKPLFIDFADFFLTELLCDLPAGQEPLVFTEMLPDAGDLWLRDRGGRYCSELRMLLLHY
jgi:hypothetical protein